MWREPPPPADEPPTTPTFKGPSGMLRRLQFTILRPLAIYLGGSERSLVRGPGMELSEVREYQPGDDVRYIDWKITARTDTPYVREANVERALDTWLLMDMSASFDWGTAQAAKRDRAAEFAAVTGELLTRHGNRVGALMFADQPLEFIPPGSGRTHLMRMLSKLQASQRQTGRGQTDLTAAIARAETVMKRKALVLVVSDFLVPDGWQPALGRLAQRHEVVGVRLRDPRESELPDVGLITLEDPETGEQLTINSGDRKLRERFHKAAEEQSVRIRDAIRRTGADYLEVSTDQDLLPTMVRFLEARRMARGGQRQAARPRPGQR
ncbi:MAG: DUF58 domain-containing protein [Anaerolineae bacterium]